MEKELQKQIKDMGFSKLGLHTKEHQVWVSGALVFLYHNICFDLGGLRGPVGRTSKET